VPHSSISKKRIALLEIDEIEQCFRRVRPAAMQLGRENEIDSFASRVSALRERVNTAKTSRPEIDVMLATLRDDVQAFLRTLLSPH
jgi:hypothetical protein